MSLAKLHRTMPTTIWIYPTCCHTFGKSPTNVKDFQKIPTNSKRFHYNLENSNFPGGQSLLGDFLTFTIRGRPNAYIAEAEGEASAEVTKATAEANATLIRAQAQAQAMKLIAEAESTYISKLKENITPEIAGQILMSQKYIDGMRIISNNAADKVFLPNSFQGMFEISTSKSDEIFA